MSLSRSLWITSAAASLAGCSDDTCGTHGASPDGLVVAGAGLTLTYGGLTSLAANDCTLPGMPDGVVSISLEGMQRDGGGLVTLCIPRPDQMNAGGRSIGTAISEADVRIIDLHGDSGSCMFTVDSTTAPTGAAGTEGLCSNGTDAAGFALELDGTVMLRRTCGTTIDRVPATIKGRIAIAKRAN